MQIEANKVMKWAVAVVLAALVAGCLPAKQTGTSYSRDEVRRYQHIELGIVVDVTDVEIEGTNTGAGGAVGGAVGGIAGSTVDDGAAGDIAAVLVGTAGAIIGAKLEDAATRAQGKEYTIRLESGEVISVAQAVDPKADAIVPGDSVKVLSQAGTYRVTKLPVPLSSISGTNSGPAVGDSQ